MLQFDEEIHPGSVGLGSLRSRPASPRSECPALHLLDLSGPARRRHPPGRRGHDRALVSLPRMESYAAMDNASDARLAVRLLGRKPRPSPGSRERMERARRRRAAATPAPGRSARGPRDLVRHHGYVLRRTGHGLIAWPGGGRNANPAYRWTGRPAPRSCRLALVRPPARGDALVPAPERQDLAVVSRLRGDSALARSPRCPRDSSRWCRACRARAGA